MTKAQWKTIKHFKPDSTIDNFGDPYQMDYRLVWQLDCLRERIGKPIIVHCGYGTSGHAPNGYHPLGEAVDFHVKKAEFYYEWKVGLNVGMKKGKKFLNTYLILNRKKHNGLGFTPPDMLDLRTLFWFCGLGIYPEWNNPGFHLDIGKPRRWVKENGVYRKI